MFVTGVTSPITVEYDVNLKRGGAAYSIVFINTSIHAQFEQEMGMNFQFCSVAHSFYKSYVATEQIICFS